MRAKEAGASATLWQMLSSKRKVTVFNTLHHKNPSSRSKPGYSQIIQKSMQLHNQKTRKQLILKISAQFRQVELLKRKINAAVMTGFGFRQANKQHRQVMEGGRGQSGAAGCRDEDNAHKGTEPKAAQDHSETEEQAQGGPCRTSSSVASAFAHGQGLGLGPTT